MGRLSAAHSVNGHMFSLLNKDGELGFRLSKQFQEKYIQEFGTTIFESYGAVMRGYVLIPDKMLEDLDELSKLSGQEIDMDGMTATGHSDDVTLKTEGIVSPELFRRWR